MLLRVAAPVGHCSNPIWTAVLVVVATWPETSPVAPHFRTRLGRPELKTGQLCGAGTWGVGSPWCRQSVDDRRKASPPSRMCRRPAACGCPSWLRQRLRGDV